MIIELNGLPGSGKTFFANYVKDKLKNENYKVINVSNSEKKLPIKTINKFVTELSFIIYSNNQDIKILLNKYNTKNAIYAKNINFSDYLKRLIYLKNFYSLYSTKKYILLFDEGIFQVITAMATDFNLTDSEIKQLIEYADLVNKKIISISYEINVNDCLNSITKRNRKICDIDNLSHNKLIKMLNQYCVTLNYMKKFYKEFLVLKRNNDIKNNYSILKKEIDNLK